MTRTSAAWETDAEANDLADGKPTLSHAITIPPFDDRRDDKDADFFDAEAGWYVLVAYRYLHLRGLNIPNHPLIEIENL
jgi:hypothetical protein